MIRVHHILRLIYVHRIRAVAFGVFFIKGVLLIVRLIQIFIVWMKISILMEIVKDIDFFFGQAFTIIIVTMLQFSQKYKVLMLDASQLVDVIVN